MQNSEKTLGSNMNQTQSSTIEENQNKKSKKDEQRVLPMIRSGKHQKNSGRPHTPMRNKNSFEISFDQQSLKRTTERQHLMNRETKIKGNLLSKDQDQVEVTTEEAKEIIVKITESSNQERTGCYLWSRTAWCSWLCSDLALIFQSCRCDVSLYMT